MIESKCKTKNPRLGKVQKITLTRGATVSQVKERENE
jgi:hypothetical protein